MTCEKCKKNKATVHLTEIHQNVKKEYHLCEECARQKGFVQKISLSMSDILGNLLDSKTQKAVPEAASLKCPDCGMTYTQFRAKARFGCARDYEVFRDGVVPLLEKIHGAVKHGGKVPRQEVDLRRQHDLIRLKRELEQTIRDENFEKAADLRDRIKNIESESGQNS